MKKNKIYQFLKKYQNICLLLIIISVLFLSRFIFISWQPDFFDANQYIWRTGLGNLKDALSTGHPPHHPGYIFFTYITKQILILFKIDNLPLAGSIPSAFFGCLTVITFFYLTKDLINKKVAIIASLILAILPYFWIANVNILVDSTMIFFYIFSLFLYNRWLDNKKWYFILLSGLSLGMSIFTHTQIAFWIIVFPLLYIYKVPKKEFLKRISYHFLWIIGPIVAAILYLWLMTRFGFSGNYRLALEFILFGNINDKRTPDLYVTFTEYRIVFGVGGFMLSLIAAYKLFLKERKLFWFLFFWFVPCLIIASQYQYANFYPRAIMIGLFPSCILIAWFIVGIKKPIIKYITLGILILLFLLQGLPYLLEIKTTVTPYNEINNYFKPENKGLLIVSNLAKTHIYSIKNMVVWENNINDIKETINQKFNQNDSVYITTDAITYPLWRYDGRRLEVLSTAIGPDYQRSGMMGEIITNHYLSPEYISSNYNETIYKISNNKISKEELYNLSSDKLPEDKKMVTGQIIDESSKIPIRGVIVNIYDKSKKSQVVNSRFDANDWMYRLVKVFISRRDPLVWAITDKNGSFSVPIPKNVGEFEIIVGTSNMGVPNDLDQVKFTQNDSQKLELRESKNSTNMGATTITLIDKDSMKIFNTVFNFKMSNREEGEDLATMIGKTVKNKRFSNGNAIYSKKGKEGVVTYGPYQYLAKGKYKIRLKVYFDSNDQPPGYLEVTGGLGAKSYGKIDLNLKNEIQELNFELAGDDVLEYRVISNGTSSFYVDYLELNRND